MSMFRPPVEAPGADYDSHTGVVECDTALQINAPCSHLIRKDIPVPENPNKIAFVLDNVLSDEVCALCVYV